MSCCGQNRQTAAQQPRADAATHPRNNALLRQEQAPARYATVTTKLHYTGVAPVRVRGLSSGRTYVFSGSEPDVAVDRRDVDSLMRIGLFRRV